MKTLRAFFMLGLTALVASVASAQPADVGLGSWKLNVEKSKFSPGPAPKSVTTRFEPAGKAVKWSSERVDAEGKSFLAEYTGEYDGKDHPLTGSPTADTVSLRRIDALTTERINKKGGKVVSTETRTVAKDGKGYTTTVKGTTAKGEPIDHVMVFDKS